MERPPDDGARPEGSTNPDSGPRAPQPYVKPELVEYGPLAKLTQGQAGSTGEGGNFTRRMCL